MKVAKSKNRWSGGYSSACRLQLNDFIHDGGQVRQQKVTMHRSVPWGLEEERGAACDSGGFGILPFVTDDKGMIEIQMPFESSLDEESWFGFAAGTTIVLVMGTNQQVVQRKEFSQTFVNAIQFATRLVAA